METGRSSWTAPLDAQRLAPGVDAATVTAQQIRNVVARLTAAGHWQTRFVRDIEQVPDWGRRLEGAATPNTVQGATFVESRLHSLRTRNAAAHKGIYALLLGNQARDWMEDKALDKVQYANVTVDIHHIFPQKWCTEHGIDDERRESIVNKTAISARTNRTIGGVAPSKYLQVIEDKAQIAGTRLDALLDSHLVPAQQLSSRSPLCQDRVRHPV